MKTIENIDQLLDEIQTISIDGSITVDLRGDKAFVPEEKQYPFVKEAQLMKLDEAIKKMPTELKFSLIKKGYSQFINDFNFEEIDIPGQTWIGSRTAFLLINYPEVEKKLDLNKLKNVWMAQVLIERPDYAEKLDLSKLEVRGYVDLIPKRPEFAKSFDFSLLNNPENAKLWYRILDVLPEYSEKCDWNLINDYQKNLLKNKYPNLSIP